MALTNFSLILEKKQLLTKDVILLEFTKPAGFSFLAGQYIQCFIPNGEKKIPRSYSICSAPSDSSIQLSVKLLPNGVASEFFKTMQEEECMDVRGPLGRFVIEAGAAYSFVATGVGIAPIMGILRDEVLYKKTNREMRLLFGVRSEKDIFWKDELNTLAAESDFFSYQMTLSRPKPTGGWSGLRGRVTEHLLHHLVDHVYYLCGNVGMVKNVRETLIKNGIPAGRIHFEIF